MSKLSNDTAVARVVSELQEAFGPGVDFELTKESDTVYRVKATAADDATISDGLDNMRATRLRGAVDGDLAVKMIDDDAADEYARLASSTHDPVARAGYEVLARDARGEVS